MLLHETRDFYGARYWKKKKRLRLTSFVQLYKRLFVCTLKYHPLSVCSLWGSCFALILSLFESRFIVHTAKLRAVSTCVCAFIDVQFVYSYRYITKLHRVGCFDRIRIFLIASFNDCKEHLPWTNLLTSMRIKIAKSTIKIEWIYLRWWGLKLLNRRLKLTIDRRWWIDLIE